MYSLYLLAKLGIVHADIKPHNIVVNEQFGNLQVVHALWLPSAALEGGGLTLEHCVRVCVCVCVPAV